MAEATVTTITRSADGGLTRLLTVQELSAVLGISVEAICRYVRSRRIPAIRVGRQIRFDEEEIRRWLKDGGCGLEEYVC